MKSTGVSLLCLLIFISGCQKVSKPDKNPLGFSFEKVASKTEEYNEHHPLDFIDVIVAKGDFSEENIDKLFRYFLQQYSESDDFILRVYTSLETYQESIKAPELEIFTQDNDIGANGYYDAILSRMRDHEWYMYNQDLEHHLEYNLNTGIGEKVKIVYIKGDFS